MVIKTTGECKICNDAKCGREIKSRIATAKVAFFKKKSILISKLYLSLRKKPMKCCICCIHLYGAVRKIDQNYLRNFKMCLEEDGHDKVNLSCEKQINIT
jgi:hypothetical protein